MEGQVQREQIMDDKIFTKNFLLVLLANFFIYLGFQMTLPIIPLFVNSLKGSDQLIGVIVGIFTFSALLFRPFAGHALETIGRKQVYTFGIFLFIISVGSFSFVTSMVILILMRIIQGIGWGLSTTAAGTIATDLIPIQRRGEGMGYYGLAGTISMAIGPALGLTLVEIISFKQFFFITSFLGLIAFLLGLNLRLQNKYVQTVDPHFKKARFDVIEKSALNPSIILFFITLTLGGHSAFLPLYAAEENIKYVPLFFVTFAVFIFISRLFVGKIYDRKGDLYVFPPGALLIFVSMLLLAWLPNSFVLILGGAIYGLGFGTMQPTLQSWAVASAPDHRKGMANATFFSAFDLGVGFGALIFGQIAYVINYKAIYIVSAFSVLIAIFYYFFIILTNRRTS